MLIMPHITTDLTLVSSPSTEPVSLDDAKNYLRVDGTDDNALISTLIKAVRYTAEQYLRSSFITQTWKLSLDKYAPSVCRLPMGPLQSITSVKSITRDGTETTLSSSLYFLKANNDFIEFETPPVGHRIEITYVTGYGDSASDVPAPIAQAMLIHLADIYDGRTGVNTIPSQSLEMYRPFKSLLI